MWHFYSLAHLRATPPHILTKFQPIRACQRPIYTHFAGFSYLVKGAPLKYQEGGGGGGGIKVPMPHRGAS